MKNPRRCVVSGNREKIEGYLVQYGTQIIYDEGNSALQRTVAIVEADDGRILEVEPSTVKLIAES